MKAKHPQEFHVLFLGKKENPFAERAADFIRRHFRHPLIFTGDRYDKLPDEVLNWEGDLLISFIGSWIIPGKLLQRASYAAINFHPGSPEYPGTGCTNFAIYNGEKEYGVTCHYMKATVDTGNIIAVTRFPVAKEDTVYSVTQQCYHLIETMFYEIMDCILQGNPLPASAEQWKRKPYTRKELNELCYISPDMTEEEVERRVKATTYRWPWAYTKIGNRIFILQS
ncbi:MAG: formyltransferase family protein [Bacteroidota bacterium]|nr:formyltransferase family protein [Bacteroidota bacterium]